MNCGESEMVGNKYTLSVGDRYTNNKGLISEVIAYKNSTDVTIRFIESGYTCRVSSSDLRNGKTRDVKMKTYYGVGFIGDGQYDTKHNRDSFNAWGGMIQRCYNTNHKNYINYGAKGVIIADKWHDFQLFSEWFYKHKVEGFQIDKDLKIIGSKLYSEDTCSFIPNKVNNLLCNRRKSRGTCPVGVSNNGYSFVAYMQTGRVKRDYLGSYKTCEEAFAAYKTAKEARVKAVANHYYSLGHICKKVYDNLMAWEAVEYP